MRVKHCLIFILLLAFGQTCLAGDDLAKYCKDGSVILRGVITKVVPAGSGKESSGKLKGLITLLFKAKEVYPAGGTTGEYCISVRNEDANKFYKYMNDKSELIIFTYKTIQAYSYDGRGCDTLMRDDKQQIMLIENSGHLKTKPLKKICQ